MNPAVSPDLHRLPQDTQALHHFYRSPALPFVEARSATDSQACYRPHTHAEWSIGVVDAGRSQFAVDGGEYALAPGDLVVIPPGRVHACNPEDHSTWSYRMLYLDAGWMGDFLASTPVGSAFTDSAWRHVCDPLVYRHFGDAFAAAREGIDVLHFTARLGQLLAVLVTLSEQVPPTPTTNLPAGIAAVRDWLDAHCDETAPLAKLAAIAGLSRYQLIRRFVRHTGMTPHAYQLDRRIQHARRLLAADETICDTALAVGFADQSHFHRSFRERVAATPGQYANLR